MPRTQIHGTQIQNQSIDEHVFADSSINGEIIEPDTIKNEHISNGVEAKKILLDNSNNDYVSVNVQDALVESSQKLNGVADALTSTITANKTDIDNQLSTINSTIASHKTDSDNQLDTINSTIVANKTNADNQFGTINSTIVTINSTINSHKTDADNQFEAVNSAIATNKTDADNQFKTVNSTIATNKSDVDNQLVTVNATINSNRTDANNQIGIVNSTIAANKTDADNQFITVNSAIVANKTDADNQFNAVNSTITANKSNADTSISNLQSGKANLHGDLNVPFNSQGLNTNNHILPNVDGTFDIGSPGTRFRALYVNEAHLATNTLYIGDTPVLGTDATSVVIKADKDQSITMKTTSTGMSNVISEAGVLVSTSGMNADVKIQTTGDGSRVVFGAKTEVDMTAPNVKISGSLAVSGGAQVDDMTVNGNLTVKGAVMNVQTQTVEVSDNMMVLNNGETGAGVTAGQAGLQINRGTQGAYYMIFDEVDDMFKVGMTGQLQTIASQNWVNSVMYTPPSTWSATIITTDSTHRFVADSDIANWNAKATTAKVTGTTDGLMIAADKVKLDAIANSATNVATSATNGNIKINGTESVVYTHPASHAASMITTDSTHNFVTQTQLNQFNNMKQAICGSSNFLGLSNGVTITFGSPLSNTNYTVSTIPTEATAGQLGDVWVIKSTTGIQVFNTGSFVGAFDYTVLY